MLYFWKNWSSVKMIGDGKDWSFSSVFKKVCFSFPSTGGMRMVEKRRQRADGVSPVCVYV